MKIKINLYNQFCDITRLVVNGIEASYHDFIDMYDHDQSNAPLHGCGDMRADRKEPTPGVLARYNITEDEYEEIVKELQKTVNFEYCMKCAESK